MNVRNTEDPGTLAAPQDTVLALADNGYGLRYRIAGATDGRVGGFRDIGASGTREEEGRTSDSLVFCKTDGTAWTSKLSGNTSANVGPPAGVSSGRTFFAGGV
ncbi:hypothetical protein AB0469_38440 [Streptomyces sp. NPDC093801]|uniref:hypothetical protein n=1 Tax=Streptomyces sp. NPDC093801 TaxID=3155203 RepID=UPI00344EA0F8